MKKEKQEINDQKKKASKKEAPKPLFDHCGRINIPSFDPGDLLDMEKAPWLDEM